MSRGLNLSGFFLLSEEFFIARLLEVSLILIDG